MANKINLALYQTGNSNLAYTNLCSGYYSDYTGYACYQNSTNFLARARVINYNNNLYFTFFEYNESSLFSWNSTKLDRYNSVFNQSFTASPSFDTGQNYALFPASEIESGISGRSYLTPDFSQPLWLTYNDLYNHYSTVNAWITISTDIPVVDENTGSDFSQISNAIYSLGAVIIVVCFFSVIYKMFIRLRG